MDFHRLFFDAAPRRRGFSLIEALLALSITAFAGAVLLLGIETSLQTTTEAVERTIADGIAQQTLDEMLTKRFSEVSEAGGLEPEEAEEALTATLGATSWELLGNGTERFDDTDDYAGYLRMPLQGARGEVLGTGDDTGNLRLANFRVRSDYFQSWRQRIDVYYVEDDDHTQRSDNPTAYRALEIFVERVQPDGTIVPLAHRKRIVTYLPPPSP